MTDQRTQVLRHLHVTNSEIGTFRSCRQKWWFTYRERLRARRTARPLAVGSAIHAGLGHVYRHLMAVQTGGAISEVAADLGLSAAAAPTADALAALAVEVMRRDLASYLKELWDAMPHAPHADAVDRIIEESETATREGESSVVRFVEMFAVNDHERYRIVAVEQPFHVPLVDASGYRRHRIVYSGVWDGVKYDPDVRDFILDEHKSTSGDAIDAERKLDMDPQTTGYVYALREALRRVGPRRAQLPPHVALSWALKHAAEASPSKAARGRTPAVGRVFYNVVRKKGPAEPKVNKDGTVSTATVDTTRAVYAAALDAQAQRLAATGGEPSFLVDARAAHAAKDSATTRKRVETNIAKWAEVQGKQQARQDALMTAERYCMRHEVFHGSDLIERFRGETFAEAGLVRRSARMDHPITRNPEHCNPQGSFRCAYRSVCIEDTPEGRAEFMVRDDVHSEVSAAQAEADEAAAADEAARDEVGF